MLCLFFQQFLFIKFIPLSGWNFFLDYSHLSLNYFNCHHYIFICLGKIFDQKRQYSEKKRSIKNPDQGSEKVIISILTGVKAGDYQKKTNVKYMCQEWDFDKKKDNRKHKIRNKLFRKQQKITPVIHQTWERWVG